MQLVQGGCDIEHVMQFRPDAGSELLRRELASIYRCDLSLLCSQTEREILERDYGVPASKLGLASFWYPPPAKDRWAGHRGRVNFCTIGTYRHPPNADAVRWLAEEVWPRIREKEPEAQMDCYGSYLDKETSRLSDVGSMFHVKGPMKQLSTLGKYRILLAPLRFGAGIKGKILDAWMHGLPVVTTPVGSEGLEASGATWGGLCSATTAEELAHDAVELYRNTALWEQAQEAGFEAMGRMFDLATNARHLDDLLAGAIEAREERRATDYVGSLLWHHTARSTEYFSRWIELKNERQ